MSGNQNRRSDTPELGGNERGTWRATSSSRDAHRSASLRRPLPTPQNSSESGVIHQPISLPVGRRGPSLLAHDELPAEPEPDHRMPMPGLNPQNRLQHPFAMLPVGRLRPDLQLEESHEGPQLQPASRMTPTPRAARLLPPRSQSPPTPGPPALPTPLPQRAGAAPLLPILLCTCGQSYKNIICYDRHVQQPGHDVDPRSTYLKSQAGQGGGIGLTMQGFREERSWFMAEIPWRGVWERAREWTRGRMLWQRMTQLSWWVWLLVVLILLWLWVWLLTPVGE